MGQSTTVFILMVLLGLQELFAFVDAFGVMVTLADRNLGSLLVLLSGLAKIQQVCLGHSFPIIPIITLRAKDGRVVQVR